MKVMLIGGAGYIGSVLAQELLTLNHEVTVVDLMWFNPPTTTHPKYKLIRKNAWDLVSDELLGLDGIVFLAGLSNDPMADFAPEVNFQENSALPAYLAKLAVAAHVPVFVHGGSCSVYGYDHEVTETTPPKTFSSYGVSKLMGEIGVLQQCHAGLRAVCFRMGTVGGYSLRMRYDLIVNAMIKDAVTQHVINVNDPEAKRPLLDIRDAVDAYIYALTAKHVLGVYNLASVNTSVIEVANTIQQEVVNTLGINAAINLKGGRDIRSYTVSTERADKDGFVFEHSLKDTIENIIDTVSPCIDYEADKYYNIKTFRKLMV
jgi:nucleoside-diphosphate-sugar epimerase